MDRVTTATVALNWEQREQVARDYLIDLLEDVEDIPFDGRTSLVESINNIIAYMSVQFHGKMEHTIDDRIVYDRWSSANLCGFAFAGNLG